MLRVTSLAIALIGLLAAPYALGAVGLPRTDEMYRMSFADNRFQDIPGTRIGVNGDDVSFSYVFDRPVRFYNKTWTEACFSSNGLVKFGQALKACYTFSNKLDWFATYTAISPLWDDLHTDGCDDTRSGWFAAQVPGGQYFRFSGKPNIPPDAECNTANFELTIYDNGDIEFGYGHNPYVMTATAGIANKKPVAQTLWAYDDEDMHFARTVSYLDCRDFAPPEVVFTGPGRGNVWRDGQVLLGDVPADITVLSGRNTITVEVTDPGARCPGQFSHIDWYLDGHYSRTSHEASASYEWISLSKVRGLHNLEARAFDRYGNAGSANYTFISVV